MKRKRRQIFSGNYSKPMWRYINKAKTVPDLVTALYVVCCRLQELEHELEQTRALRVISGLEEKAE